MRWSRILFWMVSVVVVFGALSPQNPDPLTLVLADKVLHAGAFFSLTVLGLCGYPANARTMLFVLIFLGAAIEVTQGFTATRSPEWGDFLADVLGVLMGCGAMWILSVLRR